MTPNEQASQKRRQERQDMLADLNRQTELRRQQVKDLLSQCALDRDREADKRRQQRREVLTRISGEVKEIVSPPMLAASPKTDVDTALAQSPDLRIPGVSSGSVERGLNHSDSFTPLALLAPAAQPTPEVEAKPSVSKSSVAAGGEAVSNLVAPSLKTTSLKIPSLQSSAGTPKAGLVSEPSQIALSKSEANAESILSASVSTVPPDRFEERIRKIEEGFSRLLDSVSTNSASLVRIEALERKMTTLPETLGEMLSRPHPVEAKLDSLRADLRALDMTVDSVSAQMKNCETICGSLSGDVRKFSGSLETLAGELRHSQDRVEALDHERMTVLKEAQNDLTDLQERISRVESGVVRAIHLLQASEQGSSQVAHLRERFQEIELGFQQVLQAVDSFQRSPESAEAAAERRATANVLSSLSNLVHGLRQAQLEKQSDAQFAASHT